MCVSFCECVVCVCVCECICVCVCACVCVEIGVSVCVVREKQEIHCLSVTSWVPHTEVPHFYLGATGATSATLCGTSLELASNSKNCFLLRKLFFVKKIYGLGTKVINVLNFIIISILIE